MIFNLDKKSLLTGMILGVSAYRGGQYIVHLDKAQEEAVISALEKEGDALSRYPHLSIPLTSTDPEPKTERELRLTQSTKELNLANEILEINDQFSETITNEDLLAMLRMMDGSVHGVISEMLRNDCKVDVNLAHRDIFHQHDVDADKVVADTFSQWKSQSTPNPN